MDKQLTDSAKLAQKIAKVMGAVDRIEKKGFNAHHKYNFAQETDVLDALRGPLTEAGLVIVPRIDSAEAGPIARVNMTFTILDIETGYAIESGWVGLGQDSQDKGINKAATACCKYFLLKLFLIPTGDDPDDAPHSKESIDDAAKFLKELGGTKADRDQLGDKWVDTCLKAKKSGVKTLDELHKAGK